jgi:hypothetical protein
MNKFASACCLIMLAAVAATSFAIVRGQERKFSTAPTANSESRREELSLNKSDRRQPAERAAASSAAQVSPSLRIYELDSGLLADPQKWEEFVGYYDDVIVPYLVERGVQKMDIWIDKEKFFPLLIIAASPVDPPWSDIPGLGKFLKGGVWTKESIAKPEIGLRLPRP